MDQAKVYVVYKFDKDDNARRYLRHGWWSLAISNAYFYETAEAADLDAEKYPGSKRGTLCIIDDFADQLPA